MNEPLITIRETVRRFAHVEEAGGGAAGQAGSRVSAAVAAPVHAPLLSFLTRKLGELERR